MNNFIYTRDLNKINTNDTKIIYFCHIPKTSGTSLEPSSPITGWSTRDNKKKIRYFNIGHKFHVNNSYNLPNNKGGHKDWNFEYFENAEDCYTVFPNFKFSIVRNPFDLLCSYYHHRPCSGWASVNRILNIRTFEHFINRYCDDDTIWPQPLLKENLFSQLYNEQEKCMVDLIIKYEYRNEALNILMDKFNLDFLSLKNHERNRNKGDYKKYYNPELIKLVEKKCKFELDTFRYNFKGSTDDNFFILKKS